MERIIELFNKLNRSPSYSHMEKKEFAKLMQGLTMKGMVATDGHKITNTHPSYASKFVELDFRFLMARKTLPIACVVLKNFSNSM